MKRAKGRLGLAATVVSVALHAVVLTLLARHAPVLLRPREEAGPPEPIIPILIMPRTPPAAPGQRPAPIRLHRRQLRPEAAPQPVEPLITPKEIPTPPPAPSTREPTTLPRFTVQPAPATQVTNALRGGLVGCANPSLLSAEERERCLERLGRGAAGAPFQPPAIGGAKQAEFERAGAARLEARRAKEAPVPSGARIGEGSSGDRDRPMLEPLPQLAPLRP